ncbi:TNFRSF19 [Branchiostoma lanceolatum]|uniref:TNFRSF19 protein n=1 Tax=Branchiostoma lanceolatum TaxID=7740 RepID=A0A8K0A452_BRALA|nr:TNFRSF19 [Branchiostoma lanceolatum]
MENSKTTTAFVIGLLVLHVSIDLAVQATEGDCIISQYLDSQGVCTSCNGRTCQPGEKIVTPCGKGQDVTCEPCTDLEPDHTCASGTSVRSCISCKSQNKKQVRACDANSDSICEGCLDNHYAKVSGDRVYCLHCQEDRENRTECQPEPPIIKPSGEGNDDPKLPVKGAKRNDVTTPVLITVVCVLAIGIFVFIIIIWRKPMMCKGRTYQQTAQGDVESPRPQESEGHDESPAEKDKVLCRIEGKRVRFKRQLSSSSTKSEDEEKLLGDTSMTKRKHRPPKLNLKPSSEVGEVDVHCAGPPSVHGVDAAPFPEDGTPSPFPVEEEDVFPHPTDITEGTKERPASGVDAEVGMCGKYSFIKRSFYIHDNRAFNINVQSIVTFLTHRPVSICMQK